jgi:hypothetical protein
MARKDTENHKFAPYAPLRGVFLRKVIFPLSRRAGGVSSGRCPRMRWRHLMSDERCAYYERLVVGQSVLSEVGFDFAGATSHQAIVPGNILCGSFA